MRIHEVRGGGGLRLHVREWGNPEGPPILLIHAWSQNHLCWAKQYESDSPTSSGWWRSTFEVTACPRRRPSGALHDAGLWADDLAAIIEALASTGWCWWAGPTAASSSATTSVPMGRTDLRHRFVAGAVKLGEAAFGALLGPGFLDHFAGATADDLPTNVRGMRGLVQAFSARGLPAAEVESCSPRASTVPARIRANLAAREIDGDDVLSASRCRCSSARAGRTSCCLPWPSTGRRLSDRGASWYEGVGHVPHLEDPERFNAELAALTRPAAVRAPRPVGRDRVDAVLGGVRRLGLGGVLRGNRARPGPRHRPPRRRRELDRDEASRPGPSCPASGPGWSPGAGGRRASRRRAAAACGS